MTDKKQQLSGLQWTRERAALLALVCLAAGIAGGWFLRDVKKPGAPKQADVTQNAQSAPQQQAGLSAQQLKTAADSQAAPMLEQLKLHPTDATLLTNIGNVYYDAQQYQAAVDYYGRALQLTPADAAVRTDMGTAYWYMGNADAALAEFEKALGYAPNNPNTLFNRGLVKWRGKHDTAGAIADWQKLLATSPNYEGRGQVEQMLNEVKQQAAAKPGA
ncbi:MAG TPA: tetratricopeptide repeat protein [Terracidiphilus sp.]|nr:tetratricopeptide repeat protein [Terracidiphilus sp.]